MFLNILFPFLAFLSFTSSQAPAGRWLVRTDGPDGQCLRAWWNAQALEDRGYALRSLPVEGWWAAELPAGEEAGIARLACVTRLDPDRRIEWRRTPNDPGYLNQADMNLIGMPGAWDVTTGGLTSRGDSIVVAVIDAGFQTTHEDLVDNLWYNRLEIPGDGVDNDGNGYTDDYLGDNVVTGNDQHNVNSHGTSVCGVIGARGNNGKGVTGINWRVKVMPVSGADFESQVILSYQYIIDMRKLYRQSDGAKGAFVVAANLSGGINNAWADDHPLWCEMYDKLGAEGILGICAAPNNDISVDVEGDMPTTCTSPYMIAVTNVDLTDAIVGNAGFGEQSIDIGAPGHGTLTIASGNQYKEFPGTSSATPHVAGLVALMYATDCPAFLDGLDADPAIVAARVRDVIFQTGKANNSLRDITATGRRIQADDALRATRNLCGSGNPAELAVTALLPNPVRAQGTRVVFTAENVAAADLRIDVYGSNGMLVDQRQVTAEDVSNGYADLPTGSLPAGVYHVTLWYGKKKDTRSLLIY